MNWFTNSLWIALVLIFKAQVNEGATNVKTIANHQEFKKLTRVDTNVLVYFFDADLSSSELKTNLRIINEAANLAYGIGTVAVIDCRDNEGKKLCKKLKSLPASSHYALKHYSNGEFHKDYDRQFTAKSIYRFLSDPQGEAPWEEDPSAKSVRHIESAEEFNKILSSNKGPILLMFYAPWCGHCKTLKPHYSAAAEELKNSAILAAVDATRSENTPIVSHFNVKGYPTLIYFNEGSFQMNYGGGRTKDEIIAWMKNPTPEQAKPDIEEKERDTPWSETVSDVVHLTDENFYSFIEKNPSTLVMFYAPWCGHCKRAKPEYETAAARLAEKNVNGVLAALDATVHKKIAEKYNIEGFPTFKYFKDGEYAWDVNERTADRLYEFMLNPKDPLKEEEKQVNEEKHVESEKKEEKKIVEKAGGFDFHENVAIGTSENFENLIEAGRKLVMFYAPWCGHCKSSKPAFSEASEMLKKGDLIAVDCTLHTDLCSKYEVRGYPTFKIFDNGQFLEKYSGGRTKIDFVKAIIPGVPSPKPPGPPSQDGFDFNEQVKIGTDKNFDELVTSGEKSLVMFYAPWCGHCKSAKPFFNEAAKQLDKGQMIAVDCTAYRDLCQRFNVRGYPTFKIFESGKSPDDYKGSRTTDDFLAVFGKKASFFDASVKEGTQENFNELISTGKSLVMFYAPWCGHCKNSKPAFNDAAREVKYGQFIGIDCTIHQDLCRDQKIGGYPSFKIFENGQFSSDYKGGRTKTDFAAVFPKNIEL